MKLTHPDAPKTVIEATEPEPYLSQGWVEVEAEKPPAK